MKFEPFLSFFRLLTVEHVHPKTNVRRYKEGIQNSLSRRKAVTEHYQKSEQRKDKQQSTKH